MIHDDLHTLLSLTRLHLLESYSPHASITCDKETFDFLRKTHQGSKEEKRIAPPPPKPKAIIPPLPKPVVTEQNPPPPKPKVVPPPLKETPIAKQTLDPKSSLLQALCHPISYVEAPHLADIAEKLKRELEVIPAHTVHYPWCETYPQCVIISFAAKETELFVQKMASAIQERLQTKTAILPPTLESAGKLIAYATAKTAKAFFLIVDQTTLAKAAEWLALIGDLEAGGETLPLVCKNRLYGIAIYEIQLQGEPTQEEKSTLWKALSHILSQKSS